MAAASHIIAAASHIMAAASHIMVAASHVMAAASNLAPNASPLGQGLDLSYALEVRECIMQHEVGTCYFDIYN